MNDQPGSIEAPLAQAPFNQSVDNYSPDNFISQLAASERGNLGVIAVATPDWENGSPPPPAILPVDRDGFAHVGFEGSRPAIAPIGDDDALRAAPALTPSEQARAAYLLGKRLIRRLKTGKATNLAAKSARLPKPKRANPIRAARARAVHSHAAHGGSRKAGDDGDGGDGDGPAPRPQRRYQEGSRHTLINRPARRRATQEGRYSRPPMIGQVADPLAVFALAKAAKAFEAETREMSSRLATPDPHRVFDPYRLAPLLDPDNPYRPEGVAPFLRRGEFDALLALKFEKLATKPGLKGRILILAGIRGSPGHLDIDWLYARHSRALALLTIAERRAFIEAVKTNPRAAAQSDEVQKARRAFASAMMDARARDEGKAHG